MTFEAEFIVWLSSMRSPLLDGLMLFVTNFVNYVVIFFLLLLLLVKRQRKLVIATAIALVIDAALVGGLKLLFMRPRPYEVLPVGNIAEEFPAFPSDHAARSFVLASFLARHYRGMRLFLYAGACVVAFSRVYLGVHYLTDVVAGAVIGILVSQAVMRLEVFRKLVDWIDRATCRRRQHGKGRGWHGKGHGWRGKQARL